LTLARWDVVVVEFPPPATLTSTRGRSEGGHEQAGQRPAIVVQDEPKLSGLSTVLVIPMTARTAALRFQGSVWVHRSPANGLSFDSIALVSQLRAIDRRRILSTIGQLGAEDRGKIESEAKRLLGW
jgi:mRNA interferase MazF